MKKAIYAFSGDPVTFGHIDIIARAATIFDEVIAAIGTNPSKQCIFSTDERVSITRDAVKHLPNVTVTAFQGMLADFAYENDIPIIIRGLRNTEDFNFELMLHQLSESQVQGIETLLIPCRQHLMHVSSSAAKALQLEQGLIHEYVPLNVKQKLEERISGQLIVGVTGETASGKSHMINSLAALAKADDVKVHVIDLDKLAHEILEQSTKPVYVSFRNKLVAKFGSSIAGENGFINSEKLGSIIFSDTTLLKEFNQMIYSPLLLRLRKALYHKRGLVLLESALLAETGSLYCCNNQVIVTQCTVEEQSQRMDKRGYSTARKQYMKNNQFNTDTKIKAIQQQIEKDHFGNLMLCNGTHESVLEIFNILSSQVPAFVW